MAIVGGGFTGLSAASHLLARRPGSRVAVLEAEHLGAGASGHTTGMLGPGVGQSRPAMLRRHGSARARALYVATLDAVAAVATLVAREGLACELEMSGQLVVARARDGARRVRAIARALAQLGLPGEGLDRDELDRLVHLGPAFGTGEPAAIRLPAAGTLHPLRLLLGLAERVTRRGGFIFEHARVRAIGRGTPPRLELAGGGTVVADQVVVATAGYTPGLGLRLRVARGWTGVIGYVADALPAIHRLRDRPAVLHAVGWCGHGVALSIASGAWVTAMLCAGAARADLPWFRTDPPRLPGELTRWAGFRGSVGLMAWLDRRA